MSVELLNLKRCPCCGSEAKLMRGDLVDMTVEFPIRYVGCISCLLQGPPAPTDLLAAERWNRRVPDNGN
jgi:hypothetical protein